MIDKTTIKITNPPVPNRIMDVEYRNSIPIEDFTDERLIEIANQWKADLLQKARERRAERAHERDN